MSIKSLEILFFSIFLSFFKLKKKKKEEEKNRLRKLETTAAAAQLTIRNSQKAEESNVTQYEIKKLPYNLCRQIDTYIWFAFDMKCSTDQFGAVGFGILVGIILP